MPVLPAMLSGVARVRVTMAYALALSAVAIALPRLGPGMQDQIIRHASTNLHNLSHGRVGTLFGSAFVVDAGPILYWLPGLVCLLALGELLWRSGRLVVVFVAGHVGATLLVAVGLTAAVSRGWLPTSVAHATDVGMSYGATAVLGALTPAIPSRWRPAWIGWWLAVALAVVGVGRDFTAVGHLLALVVGMVVATRFGSPRGWTWNLFALLAIGAPFGFLVLASEGTLVLAAVCGLAGAILGMAVARAQLNWSADASIQSERHASGGSSSSSPGISQS
ncbi:hypothetical protein TUM20983_27230 [Mycobacterium antarcticum]|uniref:rhomboid-like protein n=1 Tax=Mycolicibacterium sp. TUM20983 TaxID=3023369 RepID=UPI0023A046A4|nr:rhomboid-like protein [Mycolicibacterium sp. TUM20983]GLP75613.1 hypothetical protein TUM20983_27230 [Mycolicibacterium sp. TUM20983]